MNVSQKYNNIIQTAQFFPGACRNHNLRCTRYVSYGAGTKNPIAVIFGCFIEAGGLKYMVNFCNDKNCKGYGKPLVDKGYGYPVCETTPPKKTDKTLQLRKWKHQRCQETPKKGSACITPDGNRYSHDVDPSLNCQSCRYGWVKLETQSVHPARKTGDYIPAKQVTCPDCGDVINVPENWMKYDIGCSCGTEVKV